LDFSKSGVISDLIAYSAFEASLALQRHQRLAVYSSLQESWSLAGALEFGNFGTGIPVLGKSTFPSFPTSLSEFPEKIGKF
jgi:hypothetical protein